MKKFFSLIFFALFFYSKTTLAAKSDWHENDSKTAKTQLLASFYQDEKGDKKLIAGIHFKIADGWKIYGNDSGGIGLPPTIDLAGSTNISGSQIIWPQAEKGEEKIGSEILYYNFYKKEVVIPFKIDLQNLDKESEIVLNVDYGLCKEICIPANEKFSLKITQEIDQEALLEIQKFTGEKLALESEKKEEKTNQTNSNKSKITMFSAILLAIFGGAILNIMPCVLPVLSIKLLSVINHSNASLARVRFAFFSTILGILSCFVIFALLAIIIKLTGNSLGWGFQFQNPFFLVFLIVILVLFIGNLLGVFEVNFNQILATILNKKIDQGERQNNIFLPNFLSGILAVALATPCSAPFLGSAISFALTQDFLAILIIFSFIGIGFSSPYIFLIISPKLVQILPKPGAWMNQTKQMMAGLLAATIMWLMYVLSGIIGAMPSFLAGALAISLLSCVKIRSQFLKYLAMAFVISLCFALPNGLKNHQKEQEKIYNSIWQNFDEKEIYENVAKGKVVVVDITADWCITCKFNKFRVLQDPEVMKKLEIGTIVAMRGDITKPNEIIMQYLHKNNRFAIPFNAVYGPKYPNGLLTSELLTKKELFELIDKANGGNPL